MLMLLLAACGQTRVVRESPPPVAGTSAAAPRQPQVVARPVAPVRTPLPEGSTHYIVRAGDTVYGIAFRANLNFRDLAAWNGISEPYVIRVGQRLRLVPPVAGAEVGANARSPGIVAVPSARPTQPSPWPSGGSPASRAETAASSPAQVPGTAASSHPGRGITAGKSVAPAVPTAPAPALRADATTAVASPAASDVLAASDGSAATGQSPAAEPVASSPPATFTPPVAAPPSPAPAVAGSPSWRWPASGPLVGRFVAGDQTQQGINIAGSAGQPVMAAADGVVVYSGSGLVGYGELVIIKHSNEWLSAYAHNRRRLVAEGVAVKAGQVIAEMGRTGAARDMLHFEIRRNGRPVDPLQWLPAR